MNELSPCPFCGIVPWIELEESCGIYRLRGRHKVDCFIRQMNGTNSDGRMSAFNAQCLIETWNRRAGEHNG